MLLKGDRGKGYKILHADFKRAMQQKGLWAGVFLILMVGFGVAWEPFKYIRDYGNTLVGIKSRMILEGIAGSQGYALVIPLAAAFSYGNAFQEELNSRFILFQLQRSGRSAYILSKILATAFTGGMMVCCAWLVWLAVCAALYKENLFFGDLFLWIITGIIYGSLWALVGGIAAAAMKSRYMAYVVPFVSYYILEEFQEMYFEDIHFLSPAEWVAPMYLEKTVALIALACTMLIMVAVYHFIMRKKITYV